MNIINFEQIDSTNKYAKEHVEDLEDKTVVSADFQTSGYGRFQRLWVDLGIENIYMSFVLKPSDELQLVHANLTQYLSVTLCNQLEKMGINPQIKWPNDVLVNGKKVCGILAETVIKANKLKGIVLGIGVNLNATTDNLNIIDRPATSLNIELGKPLNKKEFMLELIENFFAGYENFLKNGFISIKERYEKLSLLHPQEIIKIAVFNSLKEGYFIGFDDNGNLLLQTLNNEIKQINMGEIV